jgi:hypothetical protein
VRDPATDPNLDLRLFPQDPDARQPGELLVTFWDRVGEQRRTPRQPFDPPWYHPSPNDQGEHGEHGEDDHEHDQGDQGADPVHRGTT